MLRYLVTPYNLILVLHLLLQNLHHSRLLARIFNQHASSSANILDNINDFSEARGGTACLSEARKAKVGALTVLENNEELDDEGDGLHLEVCMTALLAY